LPPWHAAGLVHHTRYHDVTLTPTGEQVAWTVLRRHHLLECYPAEQLTMPWEQVHGEAERLEHVLPAELEVRLAAKLLGWKVDIKSEEEKRQEVEQQMQALSGGPTTPIEQVTELGEQITYLPPVRQDVWPKWKPVPRGQA